MWGEDAPKPGQMPWGLPSEGPLGKSECIPSGECVPISAPYLLPLPVPPTVAVPGEAPGCAVSHQQSSAIEL